MRAHPLVPVVLMAGLLAPVAGCGGSRSVPPTSAAEAADLGPPPTMELREFVLGPGDEVKVSVWRHPELDSTSRISTAGYLSLIPIGNIQASGVGLAEFQDRVRDELARYYKEPAVAVEVVNSRRSKVYVLGEVRTPGIYNIEDSLHIIDALSRAGGLTGDGNRRQVLIIRGGLDEPNIYSFNFREAISSGDLSGNIFLEPGDVIYVPASWVANLDRFFQHVKNVLSPILDAERIRILERDDDRRVVSF